MAERTKPHVHPVDEAWLASGAESRLGPDIDIVDSHIHLWDFSTPPYFTGDYTSDAVKAGISASVYVDCTMAYNDSGPESLAPVGEVAFARQQGEMSGPEVNVAAAIVGWADLTLGDAVDEVLIALEAAGGGRFRGVRARANYDADPVAGYGAIGAPEGLMLRDDFRRGVDRLRARGVVFDLYAFHTQLAEVVDLARAFPEVPILLNQFGGPLGVGPYANARERVFDDWRAGMAEVATCPNISVKVGGFAISRIAIVTAAGRDRPPSSQEVAELCHPWVDHCLTQFGAGRCLFGSNFPVDKVAMPLNTLVNAMKRLTAHLPIDEQRAFFADNARHLYRI